MKKEIVFGPSVQGSLRMAQYTGIGEFPQSLICTIKDENGKVPADIKKLNEENEDKWNRSRPIGGMAEDIICLEMALEYGDISGRIPSKRREQVLYQLISEMYPSDKNDNIAKEWSAGIIRNNHKYMKALRDAIRDGEEIRVWYSSAPSEINGFYWLMNFFDKNKYYDKVSTMFLPPNYWNGEHYCISWGHMEPGKYFDSLHLETAISKEQIKQCSKRWKELQTENSTLRMMVSGSLVSLPVTFIDGFVRESIKMMPETFKISRLVGEVIGKCGLMLSDLIVFSRVKSMIDSGELILAEDWQDSAMRTLVKRRDVKYHLIR